MVRPSCLSCFPLLLATRLLILPSFPVPVVSTAAAAANAHSCSNTVHKGGAFSSVSFSANATAAAAETAMKPPVAKKKEHVMELFGDTRIDNYYWLRDDSRSDTEVLSYLKEENAYTDFMMSGVKPFEDQLYLEIRGRIKEDDISAPIRKGSYYYYERTLEGKEYVQHCRCPIPAGNGPPSVHDIMPVGPGAPKEHVILDENIKAQEHGYYSIGAFKVSPNNKLVAYAEDSKGDEIYTVHVIDAETGTPVGKHLQGVTSYIEWAGDETLVYITMDKILRPDKVWLHKLESDQSTDRCLYHETDDMFSLDLQASESKRYLFVGSESKNTRFIFHLDISKPEDGLKELTPRIFGIDTSVSHRGNHFFIKKRSEEVFNSEILACPLDNPSATTVLIRHRESVLVTHPPAAVVLSVKKICPSTGFLLFKDSKHVSRDGFKFDEDGISALEVQRDHQNSTRPDFQYASSF